MKKQFAILLFAVLALGLCVPPVWAQASGSVKGVCRNVDGTPMVGAVVEYTNIENGQKYSIKTNAKGEYFSLGISPGKYKVTLYKTPDEQKAGVETYHLTGVQVAAEELDLDLDLKKEQERQAKGEGLTPEQMKQRQEQAAKNAKEINTVKSLNDKLNAAKAAADSGDFDTAIANLNDANQMDKTRDLIWFKLGDYYRLSALKQTDPAEKEKRLGEAVDSYQQAIQLKQATPDKDAAKQAQSLAAYYNNLAEAYSKGRKFDDAVKTYTLAAQADPSNAAAYYFNEGAVLTNAGKADEANAAFDKAIAADPTKAEAYYQKGINLLGKATIQGDKTVPAPGTVEAFQKYLELAPSGPNAQNAKDMLANLGSPVETSFGNKKKAPPKKN